MRDIVICLYYYPDFVLSFSCFCFGTLPSSYVCCCSTACPSGFPTICDHLLRPNVLHPITSALCVCAFHLSVSPRCFVSPSVRFPLCYPLLLTSPQFVWVWITSFYILFFVCLPAGASVGLFILIGISSLHPTCLNVCLRSGPDIQNSMFTSIF